MISTLINYQEYRSILCLNGTLPEADFFNCDLPIIAADGAANMLMKMGVKPDLVVGDLDGVDASLLDQVESLYIYDQNFCDYEKALDYLESKNLLPCIVVGLNGGCLDHILNNVNIFMRSSNVLYAPPLYGCTLSKGKYKSFDLPLDTKISIIGIPAAEVTTQGFKWDLKSSQLSFPGVSSCFNRSVEDTVQIKVHDGRILILIYCNFSVIT